MLLSGTLADLDVAGIAAMTSLGRISLRLELRESSGDLIGSMVLKAGRVVSATAGGVRGRDALRVILGSASDTRFQLAQEPLDFVLSSALASVDELRHLARGTAASPPAPRAAVGGPDDDADTEDDEHAYREIPRLPSSRSRPGTAPPAPARVPMMQGRLDEFDLVTLLQTIGVGRQLIEIEVRDRTGVPLGAVCVKSGKLVAAHAGAASGLGAVSALSRAAESFEFAAYRVVTEPRQIGELASVADLGTRLAGADPQPFEPPPPVEAHDRRDCVVMEGLLADFDLPTLLHTIGCSRQHCALEIGDERALCGTIGIKSGVVVSASAGALTGIPAVQQLIASRRSDRFRLIQLAGELPDQIPLGPISHVLLHANAPAPARPPTYPRPPTSTGAAAPAPDDRAAVARAEGLLVMEGRLADFDVRTVLEVLAATRQHARLQILDPGQPPLGEIALKAGWVLSSQAGALRGKEALALLLATSPRLHFRVVTAADAVGDAAPLGQVHELLVGLPATRPARREPSTRVLRWAIPISFALGGAIVFLLVTRGGTPTRAVELHDPPAAQHQPPPAEAAAAKSAEPGPAAPPPVPAARAPSEPAPDAPDAPPDSVGLPVDSPWSRRVQTAQTAIQQLGYDPGPLDGILGPRTRNALLRFQRAQHLHTTGWPDQATWSAIAAQLMARRSRP